MTSSAYKLIPAGFTADPLARTAGRHGQRWTRSPSSRRSARVGRRDGEVPAALGLDRARSAAPGSPAKAGETLLVPDARRRRCSSPSGAGPRPSCRSDACATSRRLSPARRRATPGIGLRDARTPELDRRDPGQVVAEGVAARPLPLHAAAEQRPEDHRARAVEFARTPAPIRPTDGTGHRRGVVAPRRREPRPRPRNTPPGHLTATDLADVAVAARGALRLRVEAFDREQLIEMRLRRPARRQRRQRRGAAHDQARATRPPATPTAATSRSSARASCTTRAASASSPPTRCTCS